MSMDQMLFQKIGKSCWDFWAMGIIRLAHVHGHAN